MRSRRSSNHWLATSSSKSFAFPPLRANLSAERQNPVETICDPIFDRLALPAPSETTAIKVEPFCVSISTQAPASSQPVPLARCEVPIEQAPIQLHLPSFTPRSPSPLGPSDWLIRLLDLAASGTLKTATRKAIEKDHETEDLLILQGL